MKPGYAKLVVTATIGALVIIVGSSAASAQSCPSSPKYLPDFTLNQNCLTLNGINYDTPSMQYPGFYAAVPPPPPGVANVLRITPNQQAWTGSAWYNTQQPVSGPFSTTFAFQLSGASTGDGPGDGIAFLVQNSATSALGPEGCGIGFGFSNFCLPGTGPQTGIPNSLAIEFNTYLNYGVDPSNSNVAIQNCGGTGANSVDPSCRLAVNDLTQLPNPINLADGNVHTVTITYSGPGSTLLDVILDNVDLFPATPSNPSGGVVFDMTTIGLTNGNAWVGFTGSTYAADDNQDIQTWSFQPGAQTAEINQNMETDLTFPNASGTNVYNYNAQLTAPYAQPVVTVQPILMTQNACDALIQKNFWPAHCFVYQNAENKGIDAAVMFALTCPDSPGGVCSNNQSFFAALGSDFSFSFYDNPFLIYPGILGLLNPFPGWLKGAGPDPLNPCTPPAKGSLFQSNQITGFSVAGDPGGKTVGASGGTGSCWVATYDTPGEIWPNITITSPKATTYTKGQAVTAVYACNNPSTSKPPYSPVGPYLTAAVCTQATGTQTTCTHNSSGLSCTGTVDTSKSGLHIFTVTGIDSGGNQNLNAVIYNVK
ncbi:MAG: L-type lectin-domain containing protein [Terriglobales bacterium]